MFIIWKISGQIDSVQKAPNVNFHLNQEICKCWSLDVADMSPLREGRHTTDWWTDTIDDKNHKTSLLKSSKENMYLVFLEIRQLVWS